MAADSTNGALSFSGRLLPLMSCCAQTRTWNPRKPRKDGMTRSSHSRGPHIFRDVSVVLQRSCPVNHFDDQGSYLFRTRPRCWLLTRYRCTEGQKFASLIINIELAPTAKTTGLLPSRSHRSNTRCSATSKVVKLVSSKKTPLEKGLRHSTLLRLRKVFQAFLRYPHMRIPCHASRRRRVLSG